MLLSSLSSVEHCSCSIALQLGIIAFVLFIKIYKNNVSASIPVVSSLTQHLCSIPFPCSCIHLLATGKDSKRQKLIVLVHTTI